MPVEKAIQNAQVIRFATFEVDLRSGELRKNGVRLKLSDQPFQVLAILLEQPGQVVTRDELQKRLWPDTFVDVDHNLNTAINKIREALGDSAENPRFIETLSRRGYRFVAPVNNGVGSSNPLVPEVLVDKPKARGRRTYYVPVILGTVVVIVGALALWETVFRTPRAPRILRFTRLTEDGQTKFGPLSTDGSRIYFNEVLRGPRNLIAQVPVKGGEAVPLSTPIKQPLLLDLSKEGTDLLVGSNDDEAREGGALWVQPVAGGSPRRVGTILAGAARFGPDGTSIIYAKDHDVYSVSLDGSSPRKLLTVDSTPLAFRFSPDARVFRFSQFDSVVESVTIMEASADGTRLRKMFEGLRGEWTPDGRFFIFEKMIDGRIDLWGLPEAKRILWQKRNDNPIQLTTGPLNFADPSPSKDGKKIFAFGLSQRSEVIRYDLGSRRFVPFLSGISAEGLAFSRDGQWVAYTSYPDGMLWRSKVDGSEPLQLTFRPMRRAFLPRWSPDGKQIAFNALIPDASWNIFLVSSNGGTPQRIFPSEQTQMDANWSPDGNSLVFGSVFIPNAPIYIIDLRSKHVSPLPGSNGIFSPHWSPDGRQIAGITTATRTLMLFDFASQKWTELFGHAIGYENWSRDGKYLYFQDFHDHAPGVGYRIVRLRLSDRTIENVGELGSIGGFTTGTFGDWFGLAPDDSPLFARDISTTEIYSLEMDWP
jgi:Tol biopolymer transport system component/DNA-binding winged helix-turn-helix (wHTH) protein